MWVRNLICLHLVSDSLIALSYYSIPITLLYFAKKKINLPYKWVFLMFSAFIVACGTTHLMEVVTLYIPIYWVSGSIKAITALLSLTTAVALIPLVPKALALRGPLELKDELVHAEEKRDQLSAIVESSSDAIIGKSLLGIIETWND